ncbi:9778_t:CDS:2 [Diversispora eburnea]|uniref:9778_t:CDS:1 n=1 Tax=Diversispora eburnea TaxID=1213867 RepID=A0A9N8YXX0_9GLOM|nr:9778_t:CDS:2 [Diversispora eburnea]
MVRLNNSVFILSTIIVALIANSVFAIQNSEYAIEWTSDGSDSTSTGTLRAENNETGADTTISDSLDISLGEYLWTVSVDPGNYHFVCVVGGEIPTTARATTTGSNRSNVSSGKASATNGSGKPSSPASATTTNAKQTTSSNKASSSTTPQTSAPNAGSGAQTLKPNLLNLCLGLGAIASVIIKYF